MAETLTIDPSGLLDPTKVKINAAPGVPVSPIERIISNAAAHAGIPDYIPIDIATYESGLNPRNVGDHGTSFGLFQLHRGGLAGDVPTEQLFDPTINSQIAVQAMAPAYNRGVQLGYTGQQLLDYTAVTSGWPGNFGSIENAQARRPDYIAGLNRVFNSAHGQAVVEGSAVNTTLQDSYVQMDNTADVFRAIAKKEHIDSYKDWKSKAGITGSLNPFSYLFDQGAPIFVRFLLILIALIVVAISLFAIIRPQMEQAAGAAAAAETGGAVII